MFLTFDMPYVPYRRFKKRRRTAFGPYSRNRRVSGIRPKRTGYSLRFRKSGTAFFDQSLAPISSRTGAKVLRLGYAPSVSRGPKASVAAGEKPRLFTNVTTKHPVTKKLRHVETVDPNAGRSWRDQMTDLLYPAAGMYGLYKTLKPAYNLAEYLDLAPNMRQVANDYLMHDYGAMAHEVETPAGAIVDLRNMDTRTYAQMMAAKALNAVNKAYSLVTDKGVALIGGALAANALANAAPQGYAYGHHRPQNV